MDVTPQQAQEHLRDVEDIARLMREKLAAGMAGPILILWGVIWIAGFALAHFAPLLESWVWLVGDTLGIAGTIFLSRRAGSQTLRSPSARRLWRSLFWFWFFLFLYANIWLAVLWPWRGEQVGMFLVTLVMFAYVVMGLWLKMRFLLVLGLIITTLAGLGYAWSFFVPGYLELWLGFSGGLALFASGLFLVLRRS